MDLHLKDKVVIVTGGASGIGAAISITLAQEGAVPVIIDPGMGLRNFLHCVRRSQPRALVGIPLAQIISRVFLTAFKSVSTRIWVSGSPTARATAD